VDDPIHSGNWHRYDRYIIADNAIRPAAGASLIRYDPWEMFESVKGKYRTVQTLWGEFIELAQFLQDDAGNMFKPTAKGESLILDWCNRYGLLGILPNWADRIVLPPTYERAHPYYGQAVGPYQRFTVQQIHARISGEWFTHEWTRGYQGGIADYREWIPGSVVPRSEWPSGTEEPGAIWGLESNWASADRRRDLFQFFVDLPPNGQIPKPLSHKFWKMYQEPLSVWMPSAVNFSVRVQSLSTFARIRYFREKPPQGQLHAFLEQAMWLVKCLASAQSYHYEFGPYKIKRELVSASLLAVMAEMFLLDTMARRWALRCGRCRKLFVSNDNRAKYCSPRCRDTAQMRRHRANLKQSKANTGG